MGTRQVSRLSGAGNQKASQQTVTSFGTTKPEQKCPLSPLHLFSARSFSCRSCCIFSSICRRLQCSPQMGLCSLLGLVGGGTWLSFSSSISSICCFSRESSLKKDRDCEYQPSLTFLLLFLPGSSLLSPSILKSTCLIQVKHRNNKIWVSFHTYFMGSKPLLRRGEPAGSCDVLC